MKILELRFKNLNSLYGEWAIDFSSPEYVNNGIFAITGPTGAGKSTIMDAICLALYGATPRLGRITMSGNEIMSRQTGECFAEVTFESQAGRFRCHWSQHRARKKPDGKLADAKHEISDAVSGQILETKKSLVSGIIEEKTGMDFERFTRSILLAQGSFAAFLQAAPDERAPVLEQINGTEIYSVVSVRVHERERDERAKLRELEAGIAVLNVLSEEQEAALQDELILLAESEKTKSIQQEMTLQASQWLAGIDSLRREIAAIGEESARNDLEIEAFRPDRERLLRAQKAAELDGLFASLDAVRNQQATEQLSLKTNEGLLPAADLALAQHAGQVIAAEETTAKAKAEQQSEALLIQKTREMDVQLAEKQLTVAGVESECLAIQSRMGENTANRGQAAEKLATARENLKQIQEYIDAHVGDEVLVANLAGITVQLKNLKIDAGNITARNNLIAAEQAQLEADCKQLDIEQGQFAVRKTAHELVTAKIIQARHGLKDLLGERELREYRTERDRLIREKYLLQKIADLEAERKTLVDGQPCPLCGSTSHPYAEGNVPAIDETERQINQLAQFIASAELLETSIQALETNEKEALRQMAEAEKLLEQAKHKKEMTEGNLKRLNEELAELTERFASLQEVILASLQPFGITELPAKDISTVLVNLNTRLNAWQGCQQEKAAADKAIAELAAEISRLDAVNESLAKSLAEKLEAVAGFKLTCDQLQDERIKLYGLKNPDEEEKRLLNLVTDVEAAEKASRKAHDQAKEMVSGIKTRITTLTENMINRKPELERLERSFAENLGFAGFAGEAEFLSIRLPAESRNALATQAKSIDERKADIQTRQKDREMRLAAEQGKQLTESSLEDLAKTSAELTETLKQIGERSGAIKQQLRDNLAAREKISTQKAVIEAQKKDCLKWETLRELIGSADGKKYRNFAQGLTFEIMVAHANRQLEKMTDRYLLVRDEDQPLELNVLDNYQAGEIRSTKNLSGGESFIVSLALALGLSKMASRKVRVDSLFLDEGFGTLDEEALETALETLAGLQQDGKLIGVISHVSALKERISTQLKIWPENGGRSTIEGPGVRII